MRTTLSCAIAMVGAVDASMVKPVRTDRRVNMAINLRNLIVKFHGAPVSAHTSADAQNSNFDCMEARRKHPRRRLKSSKTSARLAGAAPAWSLSRLGVDAK